jgi:hypothetical protein
MEVIVFKINQSETIVIDRNESGFDRACDAAFRMAISTFKIDDDGHTSRVEGWHRSQCWVEVEFARYIRSGCNHTYTFLATVRKVAKDSIDDL